jgi:YYY domain-containing protein
MEYLLAAYWLAATLAFAAAAVPLCALLFPGFPAKGAGLGPGVAFAGLAVVAYWVGHLHWSRWVATASVLAVVAAGAVAARDADLPELRSVAPHLLVFVVAFAFFVAVRAVDPAVHAAGGEKFLDFGLLRALTLADSLPSEDIWFAGEPVRYYYGGILSVAAFAETIGVAPAYAYNLGLASFYAGLASGAYALGTAVADHRDRSQPLAGVLAAAIVCLGGFLATSVRLLTGLLPEAFAREHLAWVWTGLRSPEPYAAATDPGQWSSWLARYVVPDTITVTPFWSYLNGDLHAHVLAPTFLLPAVGVAFAVWRTDSRRRRVALLGTLPLFAGALAITSTWSLPTVAGVAFLAVALADTHPVDLLPERARERVPRGGASGELTRYAIAGGVGLAVALGGLALAAPFVLFHSPVNRGIAFLGPRSPLAPYVLAWGGFVAVFVAYLARRAGLGAARTAAVLLAWVAAVAASTFVDLGSLAFLVPLIAAGWLLRRTGRGGFVAVLAVAGAGLLVAVELAYAQVWPYDPNALRWNTVFKVSMQASVLWGLGAGVAAASLLQPVVDRLWGARDAVTARVSATDAAGVLVAVLVVAAALTFPAMALSDHFGDPGVDPADATTDATRFVETHHPEEAEAFRWLRTNTTGQPTMVTGVGEPIYTWVSAPSVFTGIPTVVGWEHEAGYRGTDAYETRVSDVETIYRGDRRTQAVLLAKHDVDYVYYGPLERERHPDASFGGPGIKVVFQNDAVTIYSVDTDAACEAANVTCYGP